LSYLICFFIFRKFIMKTSRIAALALLATASVGFNAYAEIAGDYQAPIPQASSSTLTRAQVQVDAVQANKNDWSRGLYTEAGTTVGSVPVQSAGMKLSREVVRSEAINARGIRMEHYTIG
jgi:hypothetical protein